MNEANVRKSHLEIDKPEETPAMVRVPRTKNYS